MTPNLNAPDFTAAELGDVAGLNRHLTNIWLQRGLIVPTKLERLNIRSRPLFSMAGIFQARMMRLLGEQVAMGPSDSTMAASVCLRDFLKMVAEESMWPIARGLQRRKPLKIVAAICRTGERWRYEFFVGNEKVDPQFGPETIFAVLPVSEIFDFVYGRCEEIRAQKAATARSRAL